MNANDILALIKLEANRALTVVTDPAAVQALEGILWIANINAKNAAIEGDNVIPFQKTA